MDERVYVVSVIFGSVCMDLYDKLMRGVLDVSMSMKLHQDKNILNMMGIKDEKHIKKEEQR